MRFLVTAPDITQSFERWVDALAAAKALIPACKGLFQEVRILEQGQLVWVYDRFHRHPQFVGPGTYYRLGRLFLEEAAADAQMEAEAGDGEAGVEEEQGL
jgi:hypothetical protein